MFFKTSLYIALTVFLIGSIYKVSTWFLYDFGKEEKRYSTPKRVYSALKGIVSTLFSVKIFTLIKVFILDVLFQRRILKESFLRWLMHICIFGGFILLLLMHALEQLISYNIFSDYYSTLNPFLFLRTFFGLLVMVGLGISFYRRHILKIPRLMSNTMDHYAIIILATIMISGFILEGVKITSHSIFQTMVEDYADFDDTESINALESYWVEKYGVVSPSLKKPFKPEVITLGRELNEMNCQACHSRPQWAFISYGLAKGMSPLAVSLDKAGVHKILWYIHFMACFIGLAYLPFSRLFHIFVSPLSLLSNAVMDNKSDPANILTRQIMELDACTHCGTCSVQCLVGVSFEAIRNVNILPSEKLSSIRKLATGKKLRKEDILSIQEGLHLCTNCTRCTLVCPSGINLQELWFNVREAVLRRDYPEVMLFSPLSFYRGLRSSDISRDNYIKPLELTRKSLEEKYDSFGSIDTPVNISEYNSFSKKLAKSIQGKTSFNCFTCTTCSSSCPVVNNFDNPLKAIDLVPHQIIHAAVIGLADMVFRSKMLWSCLGCYKCQEACPQGVHVTDIFYELKNMAINQSNGKGSYSLERKEQ